MRKLPLLLVALAALVLAAPALSASKTVTLTAKLTGATEVPGPGDSDGRGKAVVRLNATKGTVCYELSFSKITDAAAGHIHAGGTGVKGDVVVGLFGKPTTKNNLKSCVKNVDAALIRSIIKKPGGFYVNIHNAEFPGGAIRGQLRKGK